MTVSVQADLFDDLRTVTFIADSRRCKGTAGDRACLVIRAKESQAPELYIAWQRSLDEDCTVTMRVDREPAEEGRWSLSADGEALFYPGSVTVLLRRLAGARRLLARTRLRGRSPITVEFDLRDFGRLVRPYRWVLASIRDIDRA